MCPITGSGEISSKKDNPFALFFVINQVFVLKTASLSKTFFDFFHLKCFPTFLLFAVSDIKACWKGKIVFHLKLFCSALISNGELIGKKYGENLVAFSCSF